MNFIQKLLYTEANPEVVAMFAAFEKSDDIAWLAQHGYYERKQGGGGLTKSGKAFIEKQNSLVDKLIEKNKRFMESGKLRVLRERLLKHQKDLKKGTIYDGLTEEEQLAVRNIIKNA